jgi:very-short-patch-repair endonuclease
MRTEPAYGVGSGSRSAGRREIGIEHPLDGVIARMAARQRGLVTRAQLIDAGLGRSGIRRRVEAGRLHLLHRGVYAVGHPGLAPGARELAAVLACGPSATLSHTSAAALWRLLPSPDAVHVTLTARRRDGPAGVAVHHAARAERRIRDGIPVTSPLRTIADVAGMVGERELDRAVAEALALRLVRPPQLDALVTAAAGRRGVATLRAILDGGPRLTRSEAERLLLRVVARANLPRPRTNVRLGDREVDAYWPDARLVVESDGYATHSGRRSFEDDRLRDAALEASGLRVMRFTWRQLNDRPEAVAALLGAALLPVAGRDP